jgi:hypothetical protein
MRATMVFAAILSSTLVAQERAKPLQINFTASTESFGGATQAYRDLWAVEGTRIVASMERATGLRFEPGPIRAVIYEGPRFSGFGERPMQLRASYPPATKRATLVHELGHQLIADPVALGFAVTLARPGGNVTGITNHDPELAIRQLGNGADAALSCAVRDSFATLGRQEGRWISFRPAEWIGLRAAPAGGNPWHSWFS